MKLFMKRIKFTTTAFAIAAGLLMAACHSSQPIAYRPVAMGEVVNGIGRCYYDTYADEVSIMIQQGLCQPGWVAYPMPLPWHYRYNRYLSSPDFYNTYVPSQYRSTFFHAETSFGSNNKSSINAEASKGIYRGSNGKTVTADKIGVAKYGNGARFGPEGTKFGGGTGRTSEKNNIAPPINSKPVNPVKPAVPASTRGSR